MNASDISKTEKQWIPGIDRGYTGMTEQEYLSQPSTFDQLTEEEMRELKAFLDSLPLLNPDE